MKAYREPQIVGLIGQRGCGKTPLVFDLINAFRQAGVKVSGILSPGIFDGDQKIAIEMVDLVKGQSRLLARLAGEVQTELQFGDWAFYPETFDWANQRLKMIKETDVLVLDEIGPLELEHASGMQAGLNALDKGGYQLGIVTARPKCREALKARFPEIELISIESQECDETFQRLLRIVT